MTYQVHCPSTQRDDEYLPLSGGAGCCAAYTPANGRLWSACHYGQGWRTVMGTSTSTRRSGGHHINVTFSMTSDTALMWMTLGCDRPKAFSMSLCITSWL